MLREKNAGIAASGAFQVPDAGPRPSKRTGAGALPGKQGAAVKVSRHVADGRRAKRVFRPTVVAGGTARAGAFVARVGTSEWSERD